MGMALMEVQKRRDFLEENEPTAAVYIRFFRAENAEVCDESIPLSEPIPFGEAVNAPRKFYDDLSPIGSALNAALQHAGDGPAEIILVTDAAQSPGCGVTILQVAGEHLPRQDVAVSSILIRPRDSDLDTFKSLEQSGSIEMPELIAQNAAVVETRDAAVATGITEVGVDGDPPGQWDGALQFSKLFWISTLRFFDHWLWLIGFIGLAWSATWIGRIDSRRTVKIENFTREARSQIELIRQNDPKAPAALKKIENDKHRLDQSTINSRHWLWKRKAIPGWIGFVILSLLALLPPQIGPIGLGGAKGAAWTILDSQFTIAFAAIWIALLVYAGRENHRLSEAENIFDVTTKEAERLADIEQSEAQKSAFRSFEFALNRIASLEFPPYWIDSDEILASEIANFDLVVASAIEAAKKSSVAANSKTMDLISATALLNHLYVKTDGWRARTSLARFLDKTIDEKLITENLALWNEISRAIKGNNKDRVSEAINALANKLRSD